MAASRFAKGVLAVVSGLLVIGGGAFSVLLTGVAPTTTVAAGPPPATTATPVPSTSSSTAFTLGHVFPFASQVMTLSGQPTTLAHGSKATIVMGMASWCKFCAYEDKYVIPAIAKTPGIAIDVVDVSPKGGIAQPGPENPAFTGLDGTGGPLTVAGMEQTMSRYVQNYGTLSAPNVHVYVASSATQTAWAVKEFPSFAFVNAAGRVMAAPAGGQTLSAVQSLLKTVSQ